MNFVKLNDVGEIETYPYTLDMFRSENKNVSLPKVLNNAFLSMKNVYPVYEDVTPEYDHITHRLVKKSKPIYNDKWIIEWDIVEKTPETIQIEKNILEKEVKKRRDELLSETDWIVTKSIELNEEIPQKWKDYRQSLRDVSLQETFPYSTEWPAKP